MGVTLPGYRVVKQIGIERFKKYFLYNEFDMTINQLAGKCNISPESAVRVIELINDIYIQGKFHPISNYQPGGIKYQCLADIGLKKTGLVINFFD